MLKKINFNTKNILSFLVIVILIMPQTRKPIQIQVQKLIAKMSPSVLDKEDRETLSNINWRLTDLNGEHFQLNQTQGKVKVISFWATWCPPCIAELPSLQELYNTYNYDIEFVFISNENPEIIKSFLKKNNYSFPVYKPLYASEEIYFNPRTIPRTLLIDQNNTIVILEDGAANWNSDKVKKVINQLLSMKL